MKMKGIFALVTFFVHLWSSEAVGPCNDGKVRGVNIGGLFLLEPWITPNFFKDINKEYGDKVVDEYTLAQYVDKTKYMEILDRHWDTFYTKDDLQTLYDSGISHVRVPVGYWLVDVQKDEPFPPPPATDNDGQRKYLKRLLTWCEDIGLKVLIDLHGAPGSQNGFDNSGRRGPVNWFNRSDDGVLDETNPDRTLIILDKLADLMVTWINDNTISSDTLYGIEAMNEPSCWDPIYWDYIRDVWNYRAYETIRLKLPDPKHKVVIQQAFRDPLDYLYYMPDTIFKGVELDLHEYHAFGEVWNDLAARPEGWTVNLNTTCQYGNDKVGSMNLPTFVGEWSLAVCDCQEFLDGGYDNPYDPPNAADSTCDYYNGDYDTYPTECREFLKNYMLAQMDAAEKSRGFFFWTAKTEDDCGPEWDYLQLLREGIAPADLCNRETFDCRTVA